MTTINQNPRMLHMIKVNEICYSVENQNSKLLDGLLDDLNRELVGSPPNDLTNYTHEIDLYRINSSPTEVLEWVVDTFGQVSEGRWNCRLLRYLCFTDAADMALFVLRWVR